MKFFAIFATLLAVTCAEQQWTLSELSQALQDPNTPSYMIPHLEQALNSIMADLMSGQQPESIAVSMPITVNPAQEFSSWTLHELSSALQDPNTPAELVPYLEDALNTMMSNIINGQQQEAIIVATPVGLLPVEAVAPAPVVAPTPVSVETPASSPLVQIIVNVNQQEASVAAPVPAVEAPAPVIDWVAPVRPEPEHSIVPVNPVDVIAITPPQAIINPIDVIAVAAPEVNPIDVIAVAAPEVNPIDVIAVAAPEVNPIDVVAVAAPEFNPIDVVAVSAPEVNPIDILSPVPAVAGLAPVVGPIM